VLKGKITMAPSTIEDYLTLDYNVTIHRREDAFLLHLPELSLFAEDGDLTTAHNDLENAKRSLMENYFASGNSAKIPLPTQIAEMQILKKSLTPFFIKLGSFALIGVLLISAANISLTYSLQQAPKAIAQKAAKAALKNFGATLEEVARREFTPEKEERIRLGIRKLVAALKPYMDEFKPLYQKE
jgi:hypothetical protein